MDLISREAVANELEKHKYSNEYCVLHNIDEAMDMGMVRIVVGSIPSAFEGMTNGEVLKAIFPDCIDYHGIIEVKTHLDMGKTFRRSWWDSPYKGQDGLI